MTYPPAAMNKRRAAEYMSLSVSAFERLVASGELPSPISLGKHERWATAQLDKALLVLAGETEGEQVVVNGPATKAIELMLKHGDDHRKRGRG